MRADGSCDGICTDPGIGVHWKRWATRGSLAGVTAYLVQRRDGGRQAAVHAEDLVVDQGRKAAQGEGRVSARSHRE